MAKVGGPDQQHAANYGTAANPALIKTPNNNGPNAVVPRAITPAPFVQGDTRPAVDRILDQQWRDAVALGLAHNEGLSLNRTAPGETDGGGSDPGNGGGPTVPSAPDALIAHDPADFSHWRTALQAVQDGDSDACLFVIGDSTAAGALADSFAENYVSKLVAKLAVYVPTEQTFAFAHNDLGLAETQDPRITLGANWVDFSGGSFWYQQAQGSDTLDFAPCDTSIGGPETVDRFELWTWGATFHIQVDDVEVATWSDPQIVTKHVVICDTDDVHTLKIGCENTGVVVAVNAYSSQRKVLMVANRGVNGIQSGLFADDSADYRFGHFPELYEPDLTQIVLGINDFNTGVPVATVEANIAAIVDRCAVTGDSLISTQYPTANATAEPLETDFAANVGDDVAGPHNCAVLDVFNDWGGDHQVGVDRGWFGDSAHPNSTGYEHAAGVALAAILNL